MSVRPSWLWDFGPAPQGRRTTPHPHDDRPMGAHLPRYCLPPCAKSSAFATTARRFDRTTGIVMLESGVSSDKAEQAKVAMLDQLERIKAGDFSDMLLENTLRLMQNSLKGLEDTLGGLEGWYLGQILSGRNRTPAEDYAALAAVTRQQVEQAARGVTLDTTYLLKEKEAAAQ